MIDYEELKAQRDALVKVLEQYSCECEDGEECDRDYDAPYCGHRARVALKAIVGEPGCV
jgi:hypothetical protein